MKIHLLLPCILFAVLPAQCPGLFAQESKPALPTTAVIYETPAILNASQVLEPSLVAGPSHRVRELVPTDGYLAHFTVDSEFGTFEVTGAQQLKNCVQEINAIARLSAVSRSDVFAEGLKRSIEQPIDAAKNVVKHPVETVKALPSTVGHFFKKVGTSLGNAATGIKNRAGQPEGEGGSSAATAQQIRGAAQGIIGYENAKLDCCRKLGVDPYTDNPRLREEVEKVSWVFFAGGLPMQVGAMATGASFAITATKFAGLPDDVYAVTPSELAQRNTDAMTLLKVPADTQQAFATNPALTFSLRHSILVSLGSLLGAKGQASAVELAANCATRQQARFLEQAFRILAKRQSDGSPKLVEIKVIGRLAAAVDATGAFILPMPSDAVTWTPEVSEFVRRDDLAGLKPQVYHTGSMSTLATKELTQLGWSLHPL